MSGANSEDQDQTDPRGALRSGSILFAFLSAGFL